MLHNLKPYPAYKDSGVPWLGKVPEKWEVKRADHMMLVRKSLIQPEKLRNKRVCHFSIPNVQKFGRGSVESGDSIDSAKIHLSEPTLLVSRLNPRMGTITFATPDPDLLTVCSTEFVPLVPRSCSGSFADYAFRAEPIRLELNSRVDSATKSHQRVSPRDIEKLDLAWPPIPEQSTIVRYLDYLDRRIRRYIHAKKKLIKLLEEQKQAIIHQAVTRGLDANVKFKPLGIEWLGEIPEHWEVRRAKQLCTGIIDCKNRTPDIIPEGEYTVVRTTCIRNGKFNLSGSYPTDKSNYDIWTQRGAPQLGDVFFTREAPAGEACLVPDREDLCMGQRMMYFRPDPELLDPRFLLFTIYGPVVRTYIEHTCSGSTVGHLRLGQVYSLPLLWCPLEEQQEIVAYVEGISTNIDKIVSQTHHEISLLREYRTCLIADIVTGKLDVREAAGNLSDKSDEMEVEDDFEEETIEESLEEIVTEELVEGEL